jgi:glycosyltransferase involved in cell wall biosynthesis
MPLGRGKKSILCIVPFPPSITGAALASQTLVDYLKCHYRVAVLQYQRGNLISGKFSLRQFLKVLSLGLKLRFLKLDFDCVYLVISSTLWGNLRDLFWLAMMGERLNRKTVLHLHGSNLDRYLIQSNSLVKALNRLLLGKVRKAIVLGETFQNIFSGYISDGRISVVKNSFHPALLIPEKLLQKKINAPQKIRILFLSNLVARKGYRLLLEAFISLPETVRSRAELHFAGEIPVSEKPRDFLSMIKTRKNIFYHGPVSGDNKRELLWHAHVFCLPTLYQYEGQPISILEAYASGCIVLTTNNGGIKDIFIDGQNGYFISDSVVDVNKDNLRGKLELSILNFDKSKGIVLFNRREAEEKYSQELYCRKIENILVEN